MTAFVKRPPLSLNQFASNTMPRQVNRSLLFKLIRKYQSISRAELARVTGLQRSSVSIIVEELMADGWVVEGTIAKVPRGRHPMFLRINDRRAVIALDIHPEQTMVAVADLNGKIIAQNLIELPENPPRAIRAITNAIRALMTANKDKRFEGIGISLPGRTDLALQKLIFAPHLRWPVLRIKDRIEKATGLYVQIDNVANACALGEVWFGYSDGLHDLVVINVSEGIGTGIYANGQILRGETGMAGEFGHVQIDANGPPCACGSRGCWELTASNRAALRYFSEIAPTRPTPNFEGLTQLARDGDAAALKALSQMGRCLGRGMRMIATALAPREMVVVGPISTVWDKMAPDVEQELTMNFIGRPPLLRCAYDGNSARLRSAVALVVHKYFV
jgi:predicted NBD/HSP70 family sugar kinase